MGSTFLTGVNLSSGYRWNPLKKVESIEENILMSYTFLSVGHLKRRRNNSCSPACEGGGWGVVLGCKKKNHPTARRHPSLEEEGNQRKEK